VDAQGRVVKAIEPHDSVERYSALGVECVRGAAKITSPWTVEVDGKTLTTRGIVIAAGALNEGMNAGNPRGRPGWRRLPATIA